MTLEERFWRHVHKTDTCWLWGGGMAGSGYGMFRRPDKRMTGAHRMAWEIAYGSIPDGLQVCHTCDNKLCVRPDHLFIGTHLDNARDMVQKGRQAKGKRLNHHSQVGELNYAAKLNEEVVVKIKCLFNQGLTQAEISRQTGVSRLNIWNVVHRKSWVHVE